ncbi:hypothetical protein SAMN04488490_3666 [Marinobacter sp. LV10R510-11A]|nr:hypothetical protein SAMN04488490_3666 [Marinobacter sp. LV10R510-11A]
MMSGYRKLHIHILYSYTGYKPWCDSYYKLPTVTDWSYQGNNWVTSANKGWAEWEYNRVTSATKVE